MEQLLPEGVAAKLGPLARYELRALLFALALAAFGKSFPSGHSMQAVVCYGALLLVFLPLLEGRRRTAAIAATATLVVLIGFSRLSLGVHYVSDVLGGYVLGAAWLIASVAAFEIWREERGRPRTRPLEEGVEPEEGEELVETGTAT